MPLLIFVKKKKKKKNYDIGNVFFILSELLSLSKVSDVSSKVTKKSTFHRSDGII